MHSSRQGQSPSIYVQPSPSKPKHFLITGIRFSRKQIRLCLPAWFWQKVCIWNPVKSPLCLLIPYIPFHLLCLVQAPLSIHHFTHPVYFHPLPILLFYPLLSPPQRNPKIQNTTTSGVMLHNNNVPSELWFTTLAQIKTWIMIWVIFLYLWWQLFKDTWNYRSLEIT